MSGNFEVIIKIMQNQIQVKNSLMWKIASKFIEFAFEEGDVRPFGRENDEEENMENGSHRKPQKGQEQDQEEPDNSYEPSNEVIDFEKIGVQNQNLQILTSGAQIIDEVNHANVFISKGFLPTFTVNINQTLKKQGEANNNSQKTKYVQLLLAEKSHNNEHQKYKIIKGGIRGILRQKLKNQNCIKFEKNRFYYISTPQKLPRLILVLYEQGQNKRVYKSVMISDQFSVIENHKILSIQNNEQLRPYFQNIQTHFLEKTSGPIGKINTLSKHKITQEMSTFESYLIKKNKKIWNLVYAAYKYSHIIDLYFLNPQNKPKKETFLQLWKQVLQSLRNQQNIQGQKSQKTCNHLNPSAKFVLKINAQMRSVRFITAKQFTKHLSIIACETQFDPSGKWVKFQNINQMKQVYIACQSEVQVKMTIQPIVSKANPPPKQVPPAPQSLKKNNHSKNQKNDDQDFNEEDVEDEDDDMEYEGQSSQNYSISNRKRGRKLGQKKNQELKKPPSGYINKEPKYPTRGGSRRGKEDTEDSNDKKNAMNKKLKQKQSLNRTALQAPTIGTPPFRVLSGSQACQYKDQQTQAIDNNKMIGIIPMMNPPAGMMIGQKKPEDNNKSHNPVGMPKQIVPVMMAPSGNPQMMAMMGGSLPAGMQMMPVGGNMPAVMMPMSMDKSQQGQSGMPNIAMGQMGAMGAMGMGAMTGMPNLGAMGMSVMPMMMGSGGAGGMPQGFVLPASMMQSMIGQAQGDNKQKQGQADKSKHQGQKKQQKKDSFPPQAMSAIDLSKMGVIGQLPGGVGVVQANLGMQMPQMMQMGMGGLGGMMGGNPSMPQGIMMNPMMQLQKSNNQGKQQGGNKQNNPMQNPMFGGMPFMMQMPTQMQSSDTSSQNPSGMQIGMMGQFPAMMQMPQAGQMSGAGGQGGMPMGYTMVMNPEQLRGMNPQNQQFQNLQMMMMSKGMMPMPAMMSMPKNDQNDQSKK